MTDLSQRDAALSSLDTIRSVMVRATRYTHISAVGILLGGVTASSAALLGLSLDISPLQGASPAWSLHGLPSASPPASRLGFVGLWAAAFGLALLVGFLSSARKARRSGETFWNRKLQFVALGFFPAPLLGCRAAFQARKTSPSSNPTTSTGRQGLSARAILDVRQCLLSSFTNTRLSIRRGLENIPSRGRCAPPQARQKKQGHRPNVAVRLYRLWNPRFFLDGEGLEVHIDKVLFGKE